MLTDFRLQTQAGTYVKEFVHSDFGRTRPSVAPLMGLELDQVDIRELDVEDVDFAWPPSTGFTVHYKRPTANGDQPTADNRQNHSVNGGAASQFTSFIKNR